MTWNNITGIGYDELNPLTLNEYVSIEQCKNFVADTIRTNYILMGCIILLGLGVLYFIYLQTKKEDKKQAEKHPNFFKLFKQNFDMLKKQYEEEENGRRDISDSINSDDDSIIDISNDNNVERESSEDSNK